MKFLKNDKIVKLSLSKYFSKKFPSKKVAIIQIMVYNEKTKKITIWLEIVFPDTKDAYFAVKTVKTKKDFEKNEKLQAKGLAFIGPKRFFHKIYKDLKRAEKEAFNY